MLEGIKRTRELLSELSAALKPKTNADRIRSMTDPEKRVWNGGRNHFP